MNPETQTETKNHANWSAQLNWSLDLDLGRPQPTKPASQQSNHFSELNWNFMKPLNIPHLTIHQNIKPNPKTYSLLA